MLHKLRTGIDNIIPVLINDVCRAERVNAENPCQPVNSSIEAVFGDGMHIDASLLVRDFAGYAAKRTLHVGDELLFKKRSVKTFEMDLGVTNEYDFFHDYGFILSKRSILTLLMIIFF